MLVGVGCAGSTGGTPGARSTLAVESGKVDNLVAALGVDAQYLQVRVVAGVAMDVLKRKRSFLYEKAVDLLLRHPDVPEELTLVLDGQWVVEFWFG